MKGFTALISGLGLILAGSLGLPAAASATAGAPVTAHHVKAAAAAKAAAEAVAYQVDSRHDGDQGSSALSTRSLSRKWTVTLGGKGGGDDEAGDVSYPIIAGGRVFVTVENTQSYGSELYALNAATGKKEWSAALGGTYGFSALAYDGQRVFAINNDAVLTAFSASTGHEDWAAALPGYDVTAAPVAYGGAVYATGPSDAAGGALWAVSEATGRIEWTASVNGAGNSSPAVGSSGVYLSLDCQQDYRFSLSGALIWHHNPDCYGGGGSTTVISGNSVYARGAASTDAPLLLAKSTGRVTGSFASSTAPAVAGSTMYTLQQGKLVAVSASGSPDRWKFGNGSLVTAPIVDGSVVYVGSSDGRVYGVSATTGHQVWSGRAGSQILGPDEQNADVLIGMAAAGGRLVVPAGRSLTAFSG
jgi:outer membrane protein assembly factor BamB